MSRHISNMEELQVALMPTMVNMVDVLAERVYQTLNYFLQEYYNSYDPKSYRRQYDFLRSAVKVKPRVVRNKWQRGQTRDSMAEPSRGTTRPTSGMTPWMRPSIMENC